MNTALQGKQNVKPLLFDPLVCYGLLKIYFCLKDKTLFSFVCVCLIFLSVKALVKAYFKVDSSNFSIIFKEKSVP